MSRRYLIKIYIELSSESEEIYTLNERLDDEPELQTEPMAEGMRLDQIDCALMNLRQACRAVLDGDGNAWRFVDSCGRKLLSVANDAFAEGIPFARLSLVFDIATIAQINGPIDLGDRLGQLRGLIEKINEALDGIWE